VNILLLFSFLDFGVSVWLFHDGTFKKKPFYIGGKGIYEISGEDSFTYQFDIRFQYWKLLNIY
jgi:hypothetical protein